jgi:hypothetical protein
MARHLLMQVVMLRITTFAIIACATLGIAARSADAGHDVIIYSAPPAAPEYYDDAYYDDAYQQAGYVWVEGRWDYLDQWVWIPGYWTEARADMTYVQGCWESTHDGYRWSDGYWQRAPTRVVVRNTRPYRRPFAPSTYDHSYERPTRHRYDHSDRRDNHRRVKNSGNGRRHDTAHFRDHRGSNSRGRGRGR